MPGRSRPQQWILPAGGGSVLHGGAQGRDRREAHTGGVNSKHDLRASQAKEVCQATSSSRLSQGAAEIEPPLRTIKRG